MTRSAAIIGGGIGGLATAIRLHHAGWAVRVFERSSHRPATGTALGMWPPALRALDTLGIGARVREIGAPQRGGSLRRPDGSRIGDLDTAAMVRRSGDTVHLISRPALVGLLADALPAGIVELGTEVTNGGGRLDLAALRAGHDVVVVADGVFSRIRTAVFGAATRPRYVGATAWRGTVDGAVEALTETWGPGRRFGTTPREDGRTNWYATLLTPEGTRFPQGDLAALRDTFAGWHEGVRRVLDTVSPDEMLRHDLYDLDRPLRTYVEGTVALVGDAAHAMTPDLGRGACEALIDGVTIADRLTGTDDVRAALAAYDRERRRPTQRLARIAGLMGRLAQARRFTGIRDVAVRAATAFGPPA
ncbi:FAD-dependent monooxygenase [Polymorphospora rubra]|uniref:FAD-dependent oxidoreductase n=1 Tax=Polymorphospora rubra TaxID=338584 RepID=A0A810MQQ1_9ACTN|nr:FAD-dependent monooxygenase [Polymorphospora rubra]BCJ63606.1 FAD-dependent oxidoreductase [Polymorphospora rubra]